MSKPLVVVLILVIIAAVIVFATARGCTGRSHLRPVPDYAQQMIDEQKQAPDEEDFQGYDEPIDILIGDPEPDTKK